MRNRLGLEVGLEERVGLAGLSEEMVIVALVLRMKRSKEE